MSGGAYSAREKIRQSRRQYIVIEDWENGYVSSFFEAGGGATQTQVGVAGSFGARQFTTGITTTGHSGASSNTNPNALITGSGTLTFEADFTLSAVPDGTDQYSMRMGFADGNIRTAIVDGIYFEVDWSGAAARYSLITISNSTETRTVLSGTPDTNKHTVTIVVNAAGTSVTAYIDDVAAGTSTTNIPTGTTRLYSCGIRIEKQAGTTDRNFINDRVAFGIDFTAAR